AGQGGQDRHGVSLVLVGDGKGRGIGNCDPPGLAIVSAFDRQCHALAAADAQSGQAAASVAALHFVEQADQDAAAGGADGVAEGDGTAVDVDLGAVPVQFAADGNGLGGEGFVGLDQVQLLQAPASTLQRLAAGEHRADA